MAEAEQEEVEGKKGGFLKVILLLIPPLLIGLGAGYYVGKALTEKAVEEAKVKEPEAEQLAKDPASLVGAVYKLEPFVVNLNDPKGNRYLKTTVQMEMDSDALQPELERRQPQIQDIILALLTSKTTQELQSLEGKFRLREELLSRINALLVNGKVKRIYFTEFVIQ